MAEAKAINIPINAETGIERFVAYIRLELTLYVQDIKANNINSNSK